MQCINTQNGNVRLCLHYQPPMKEHWLPAVLIMAKSYWTKSKNNVILAHWNYIDPISFICVGHPSTFEWDWLLAKIHFSLMNNRYGTQRWWKRENVLFINCDMILAYIALVTWTYGCAILMYMYSLDPGPSWIYISPLLSMLNFDN